MIKNRTLAFEYHRDQEWVGSHKKTKAVRKPPQEIIIPETNVKQMRKWQKEAFAVGKDARFFSVEAFCGSGKSVLQICLAIYDIVKSKHGRKQLILVPQKHIGHSFFGEQDRQGITVNIGNKEYNWSILNHHNFVDGYSSILRLRKWLLTPADQLANSCTDGMISGLNAICSHQALALVWDILNPQEKEIAVHNLTLRPDEFHHASNIYIDEDPDLSEEQKTLLKEEATKLGLICTYFINSKDDTCKIHTTTATMFRSDYTHILLPYTEEKFTKYQLDWVQYLEDTGITDFYVKFTEYDEDPIELLLENIRKDPRGKHFITIPADKTKWRYYYDIYLRIVEGVKKIGRRPLDLVTKETQEANKKLLLQEPKRRKGSKFDVIITCGIGREGTDWVPCTHVHNLLCTDKRTLLAQLAGRPFRRCEGKKVVKITNYVKKFVMPTEEGITKRELFSDRANYLLYIMAFRDLCTPLECPTVPYTAETHEQKDRVYKNFLADVLGNNHDAVLKDFTILWSQEQDKTTENVDKIIALICDKYNVDENLREQVRDHLLTKVLRCETKLDTMSVAYLRENGLDKIREEYVFGDSPYFVGKFNKTDWELIREIENSGCKTPEEWVPIAEKLAEENGGNLPHKTWLRNNNYSGLALVIINNPKLFEHIQQACFAGRSPEEWVVIAEKLAGENDGKIPCNLWLRTNGYTGLCSMLLKHPHLFTHILRSRLRKTVEDHIRSAEQLAKENGGNLPPFNVLRKNGFSDLNHTKQRHPYLFNHIPQENKRGISRAEWVSVAEQLAKENDGNLPCCTLLKDTHSALYTTIMKHPHLFAHIPRESRHKTPEEYVVIAEKLAEQNDGEIPCQKDLIKQGYSALQSNMKKHPHLFAHIPQIKKNKRAREWISIAEEIAKENGGNLPTNLYSRCKGLYLAMRTHPHLFKHIKRL